MSDQNQKTATEKTALDKLRELPVGSGIAAVVGIGALTETFNIGMFMLASPVASAAVAVPAIINAFDKKRSGLSRVFSAAAAVVGVVGAALPFVIAGPAALGGFLIATATMAAAGAFNVAAYALRNKQLPFSLSIKKTPKAPAV